MEEDDCTDEEEGRKREAHDGGAFAAAGGVGAGVVSGAATSGDAGDVDVVVVGAISAAPSDGGRGTESSLSLLASRDVLVEMGEHGTVVVGVVCVVVGVSVSVSGSGSVRVEDGEDSAAELARGASFSSSSSFSFSSSCSFSAMLSTACSLFSSSANASSSKTGDAGGVESPIAISTTSGGGFARGEMIIPGACEGLAGLLDHMAHPPGARVEFALVLDV